MSPREQTQSEPKKRGRSAPKGSALTEPKKRGRPARYCEDEDDEEPLPQSKKHPTGKRWGYKKPGESLDDESEQTLDLTDVEREKRLYLLPEMKIYDTNRGVINQLICDWKARNQINGSKILVTVLLCCKKGFFDHSKSTRKGKAWTSWDQALDWHRPVTVERKTNPVGYTLTCRYRRMLTKV